MSNGDNRFHAFIEHATDPKLTPGLDAPVNSICTYLGKLYVKTGAGSTGWEKLTVPAGKPEQLPWYPTDLNDDYGGDRVYFYESDGTTSQPLTLPPFSLVEVGRRYMFVSTSDDTSPAGEHFLLRAWQNDVPINDEADTQANPFPLAGAFSMYTVIRGLTRWILVPRPEI